MGLESWKGIIDLLQHAGWPTAASLFFIVCIVHGGKVLRLFGKEQPKPVLPRVTAETTQPLARALWGRLDELSVKLAKCEQIEVDSKRIESELREEIRRLRAVVIVQPPVGLEGENTNGY